MTSQTAREHGIFLVLFGHSDHVGTVIAFFVLSRWVECGGFYDRDFRFSCVEIASRCHVPTACSSLVTNFDIGASVDSGYPVDTLGYSGSSELLLRQHGHFFSKSLDAVAAA